MRSVDTQFVAPLPPRPVSNAGYATVVGRLYDGPRLVGWSEQLAMTFD